MGERERVKGGALEHPDSAPISRPQPSRPLTQAPGVFPRTWGEAKERKGRTETLRERVLLKEDVGLSFRVPVQPPPPMSTPPE